MVFDSPDDGPDQGPVNRRLFDIVADEYARKGGDAAGNAVLPGGVTNTHDPDGIPYGGGRADIRLALGGDGEIYVLSKSDGMIRQLVAVVAQPPPGGRPTVTVATTDASATEAGVTTGRFAVSRTGSTAGALTVSYTVSGSAIPGSDYTAFTGSVTIPAAAASATITVMPINDAVVEPSETVVLSLSPDAAYFIGAPGSATVTIVSDDVTPPEKDLVIEGLTLTTGSVAAGGSVTASYRVVNRGSATVTETYTDKLYLSTNATLEAGDVLLGTSHGHTVDLALNATHNHSQAVTVPAGTGAGSYFLLVQAEALEAVIETDEGNNVAAVAVAVTPPPPTGKDLVIEGLTLTAGSVAAGRSVTASYRVVNRGSATVTETYTDKLYLSTNATLDAGDVLLGTSHGHTVDLALNATHNHSQAVTVPAGTGTESYFLLVQAEALAAVTEIDEENNVAAVTVAVTLPPPTGKDLVIEGLTLTAGSVAAGRSVTASYRVVNRGSATVTETYTDKLYLSTNATLDAGDVLLGTSHGHTVALALNATHNHSQTVTVPAGTGTESYFLLVQAEALAAVTETDEGNNVAAVALLLTAP